MISKTTLCSVLFAVIYLSGCNSDDTSSTTTEPLLPLWIVDADQGNGTVQVSGRVTRRGNDDGLIRNDFDLLTIDQDIEKFVADSDDTYVPIGDSGIRLVGKDRMSIVTENGAFQLRRREMLFNYRTRYVIGQTLADVELRLDYAARRFAPSVTASQYISVTNFVVIEDNMLLNPSDAVNLAWNISDFTSADSDQLIQRIFLSLENCDRLSVTPNELVLPVSSDARSITIDISRFPVPVLSNPTSGVDPGTCEYKVQVIAAVVPGFLLVDDNSPPLLENEPETRTDAIVVNVGRSASRQVQVVYEN